MKERGWERKSNRQSNMMAESKITLGDKLTLARYEKRVSTQVAAQEMGISTASLNKWENDIIKPKYEHIKKLMSYYGMSAEELMDD